MWARVREGEIMREREGGEIMREREGGEIMREREGEGDSFTQFIK